MRSDTDASLQQLYLCFLSCVFGIAGATGTAAATGSCLPRLQWCACNCALVVTNHSWYLQRPVCSAMDALCGQIDMASSTSEAHCSSCLDSAQLLALLWFQSSAVRCVSCLIRCTTGWRDVQPLLLAVLGRTAAVFSNPLEPQRVAVVRAAPHPGSWCCM